MAHMSNQIGGESMKTHLLKIRVKDVAANSKDLEDAVVKHLLEVMDIVAVVDIEVEAE